MDWIDDCESITVDVAFCHWLAEGAGVSSPDTGEVVATDPQTGIRLVRWNLGFITPWISGDPDEFDGLVGGDSSSETVAGFPTWMTQRQAWRMWSFFRSVQLGDEVVVELRLDE